jgi:hypothetical protein
MLRRLMIKSIILSTVLFLAIGLSGTANAQKTSPYDTLYLDIPLPNVVQGVDYPALMTGRPDSTPAHYSGSAYSASRMTPWPGGPAVTMQKGLQLIIYYFIPTPQTHPTDVNVGRLRLQRLDDNFIPNGETDFVFHEPGPNNAEHKIVFTIPDTGFNTVALEVATDSEGNSLWIDAVVLVQAGVAGVTPIQGAGVPTLSSYPNPFYRAAGTTVSFTSNVQGSGVLRIYDLLGNEVSQAAVGELSLGEQNVKIAFDRAGIFFARLFVNGEPSGSGEPLKIVSE